MDLDHRIKYSLTNLTLRLYTSIPDTASKIDIVNDMINQCGRYQLDGVILDIYWVVKGDRLIGTVQLPKDSIESHPEALNDMVSKITTIMLITTKQKDTEYES